MLLNSSNIDAKPSENDFVHFGNKIKTCENYVKTDEYAAKPVKYKCQSYQETMLRGKSPLSELSLEKIKSNNSLLFEENLEREIISLFVKISLCHTSSCLF